MEEQALPVAATPEASAPAETAQEGAQEAQEAAQEAPVGQEAQDTPPEEPKPPKTPEQREIERMRRKIDRLVRQREELRARVTPNALDSSPNSESNSAEASDGDAVTLSRAELQRLIEMRAREVAPVIKRQSEVIEHRQRIVGDLARSWGQEKFDALASDLDDAFGGLADQNGMPRPAVDAIFEADDPKQLIEFLADPENAAAATRLASLSPVQAGLAVAKLEADLKTRKASEAPKQSNAPVPLAKEKGSGPVQPKRLADLTGDFDAFVKRRQEMLGRRH